ncbi:MAG: DUF1295 domain-containing protein [Patescibacteria group bacterium]
MSVLLLMTGIFASVLLLYLAGIFLLSRVLRDNSIMDIAYGPAFAIAAIATLLLTDTASPLPVLIATCITIWALRLFTRILRKNFGKPEDARYAAWREKWLQKGSLYFIVRSFLQVNLLQGVIILLVASPFIISIAAGDAIHLWFVCVGFAIYAFGLTYESIADWQLDRFIAGKKAGTEPANLMVTGLFRYSRRPNYFGETLIWWGLAIMALPLPFGYLALISPLLITFIVTRVTGPMLEEIFLEKYPEEYRAYMERTSYFFPLPPTS